MTEDELKHDVALTLSDTTYMKVMTYNDYVAAGNYLKVIKERAQKIADYWRPKKEQAAALHKSLVAAEKELLAPLETATAAIKSRMLDYQREQERIRQEQIREQERMAAEARRKAEEAARLAEEASWKDELDDADVDILRMAQAEVDTAVAAIPQVDPKAKVVGISTRKVWKARVVDDKAVPVAMMGIMLRPIDMTALNRLAVASSGGAEVPGVEFYQDESMSVRY
jgi:seryl-tRNA synthetase